MMKLSMCLLAMIAAQQSSAQRVPAPSFDCGEMGRDFYGSAEDPIKGENSDTTCPVDTPLPGEWATCPTGCAEDLQFVVDELNCCVLDYLSEFADAAMDVPEDENLDHMDYPNMAWLHLQNLCEVNTTSVMLQECRTRCDITLRDFEVPSIADVCPEGLPGNWEMCSDECGAALQSVLNGLDCCMLTYLKEFPDMPDMDEYAIMAFQNVVPLCGLDTSSVTENEDRGTCLNLLEVDGASQLATSVSVLLLALVSALLM